MFSSTFVQSFILAAALAGSVSAHGVVESIILDGKTYTGPKPLEQSSAPLSADSPIRVVQANGPAAGNVDTAALACGLNQKAALFTAPVTAGSKVSIQWSPSWPHQVGPILTYLGACNGDCEKTDPTKINFFKIHQAEFVQGTTQWIQDTTLKAGKPFTFTLPSGIPNGKYIMRHEVIALHRATEANGAEFYPSCIQVEVSGGSGSLPSSTVRFPGAYSATDPGIKVDVFSGNIANYVMPGPAISLGGDDGGDDGGNDGGDDGTGDDTEDPSTSSVFDIVTSTSSAGSSQTSAAEEATTSEAAEVTSTSSRRRPVRTSSTPAATPTSAPGNNNGSKPFTRQNGLDAIALNEKFKGIKASDPCQDGDMGCVGDSFAQCVGGKWLLTQCSAPTICAALPLVNKPGTSIACTTAEDRDSRIALTGALRMIKRHRRNLVPHVVGSF